LEKIWNTLGDVGETLLEDLPEKVVALLEEDRRRITELETELKQTNLKLKRSERAHQQEARSKSLLERRYEKLKEKYDALAATKDDGDEEHESTGRRGSRDNPKREEYISKLRYHRTATKQASPQKGRKVVLRGVSPEEVDNQDEMEKENTKTRQPIRTSKDGLVLRNGRIVGDVTADLDGHFDKLSLADRGRRGKQTKSDHSGVHALDQTQDEQLETEMDGEEEEEEEEESENSTPIGKRLPRRGVARK